MSNVKFADPQNVLESKRFIKGMIEYPAPSQILQPVLDRLKTTDMNVTLSGNNEVQNANTDKTKNTAWGRVNIQAKIQLDDETSYELGVLFALDLKTPKVKIYRGPKVHACLNLCVFGADDILQFDMTTGFDIAHVNNMLKDQAAKIKGMQKTITTMKSKMIKQADVKQAIGGIFLKQAEQGRAAVVNERPLNYGLSLLTNEKSRYNYKQEKFNHWLLYNAMTEYYSDKKTPLFEIPEAVFSTHDLINHALKLN